MDSHSNLQVPNCGPLTAFWPCASSDSLWSCSSSSLHLFSCNLRGRVPQTVLNQLHISFADCHLDEGSCAIELPIPVWSYTVNSRVFLMQELPWCYCNTQDAQKLDKNHLIRQLSPGVKMLVFLIWTAPLAPTPFTFDVSKIFPKGKSIRTQNNWQIDRHPGRCPAELWRWPNHGDQTCRPHLLLPLQCYNQEDELRDFLDFLGIQTCEILSPMSNSVSSLSFPKKVSLLGRPKRYPWFCKKEDRKRKGKEEERKTKGKEQPGKGRGKERERKRKEKRKEKKKERGKKKGNKK